MMILILERSTCIPIRKTKADVISDETENELGPKIQPVIQPIPHSLNLEFQVLRPIDS